MGVVINDTVESIEGLVVEGFQDIPALRRRLPKGGRTRNAKWIRGIVLHTTKGHDAHHVVPAIGKGTVGLQRRYVAALLHRQRASGSH